MSLTMIDLGANKITKMENLSHLASRVDGRCLCVHLNLCWVSSGVLPLFTDLSTALPTGESPRALAGQEQDYVPGGH